MKTWPYYDISIEGEDADKPLAEKIKNRLERISREIPAPTDTARFTHVQTIRTLEQVLDLIAVS